MRYRSQMFFVNNIQFETVRLEALSDAAFMAVGFYVCTVQQSALAQLLRSKPPSSNELLFRLTGRLEHRPQCESWKGPIPDRGPTLGWRDG